MSTDDRPIEPTPTPEDTMSIPTDPPPVAEPVAGAAPAGTPPVADAPPTGTAPAPTATPTAPVGAPVATGDARYLRIGTIVWGLVIAVIGVGLLAFALGVTFDVELASIIVVATAGVLLLVGSVATARGRR